VQIEGVQVPRGFIMGESSRAVAQFAYFSDLEPGNSVFPFGEFYSGWPAVCTDRHMYRHSHWRSACFKDRCTDSSTARPVYEQLTLY
jgi:hypothetical protein